MNCVCTVCGSTFNANPNWHHSTGVCSDGCRKEAHRAAKAKYKKTEKGLASYLRWCVNPIKKVIDKRSSQRPEAKAKAVIRSTKFLKSHPEAQEKKRIRDILFGRSEQGKEINKKAREKYNQTEHGTAMRKVLKANRRSAKGNFTPEQWIAKKDEYGNKCAHCGMTGKLTVDHIVPLKRSGNNYIENIQPLCKSCNSRKGARHVG